MATKSRKETAPPNETTAQSGETTDFSQIGKGRKRNREKGAGSIVKVKKWFYLRFMRNGKTASIPLVNPDGSHCKTRIEAEKAAETHQRTLHAETKKELASIIAEQERSIRQSSISIHSAWETYLEQPDKPDSGKKTESKYRGTFDKLINWIIEYHPEITGIAEIDGKTAKEFMKWVWDSGVAAITYNEHARNLRMIFKYLKEPAGLEINPFEDIPHKKNQVVPRKDFTEEQVKQIFDGFKTGFIYETEVERISKGRTRERVKVKHEYVPIFKDEMEVLFYLCCYSGCRGQDGALMKWNNIDLDNGIIAYTPRKTRHTSGNKVVLPIQEDLLDALYKAESWRDNNKSGEDYILPNIASYYKPKQDGTHNPKETTIQKIAQKIIRYATGLKTTTDKEETTGQRKLSANAYGLHSFRHTFVSFCIRRGVPDIVIASIVGHGNPIMTEHYAHIALETKRNAINALPSPNAPPSTEDDYIEEPLSRRRTAIIDVLPMADAKTLSKIENVLKKAKLL